MFLKGGESAFTACQGRCPGERLHRSPMVLSCQGTLVTDCLANRRHQACHLLILFKVLWTTLAYTNESIYFVLAKKIQEVGPGRAGGAGGMG